MFVSCGRTIEEENPSDTETASLPYLVHLSLLSGHGRLLAHLQPVHILRCSFLSPLVLRMWDDTGGSPADRLGRYRLLKGNMT